MLGLGLKNRLQADIWQPAEEQAVSLTRVGDLLPDRCSKCNESKYSQTILNPYVLAHHVIESATQTAYHHIILIEKYIVYLAEN